MSVLKRPVLICAVLAVSVALAVGACGSSSNNKTIGTAHAVVGFAAHAGLAFGAFKLFIYDPYKAGKLKFDHPFTLAKAGVAALFAYHEAKKAIADVRENPHLSKLAGPLTALAAAFTLLKSHLEHGDTSAISGVQSSIGSIGSQASSLGSPIHTVTSGLGI